jgi:HSP20 family protein
MKKRRSFFEKLTGGVHVDDFDDDIEQENEILMPENEYSEDEIVDEYQDAGQLSIDLINTPDEIIIKAMIAGVRPQDLDIQISRDMISISGTREEEIEANEEDYYHRELFWGSFSRNILLPEEIDVEASDAKERHGLLEVRLPKIDKNRKTKLSVKSS